MMASEDRKENDQNETLAVVTHLDSREVEETPTVVSVGCSLLETTPQVKEVLACGARCVQGKNKKLSDWFTFCSNEPCVAWSVVRRAQEEIAKEQKENKFTLTALIEGTPSFEVHEPRVAMISIKFVLKLVKFDGALAILVLQRLHHLRQRHAFVGAADLPKTTSCPRSYTNVTFQAATNRGCFGVEANDSDDEPLSGPTRQKSTALTPAVLVRPTWTPDKEAPQCAGCQAKFHFFYRRHHCRMCGAVFCWRCSRARVKIPEMDYQAEVRVCLQCHESRLKKKTSKWQRILDEFEIMNMVGAGGIGKVYKVMQKTSKRVFAMKVIEKKSIRSEHCALGVGAEKFVLSKIQHPFIIRLHHTFQTHDKLFFVMDFMPRGDLFHLMTTVRIPEAAVKLFLAQIGMALNYLHESGWIYRDLKPENCLMADDGNVVLTDLGMALSSDEESLKKYTVPVGTPEYWSPELIRGLGYTVALDYWQLGVLMCELLTGVHPFMDKDGQVYVDAIEKRPPKLVIGGRDISTECQNLVGVLLRKNHMKRLQDWGSFKNHQWFADLDFNDVHDKTVPVPEISRQPLVPRPPDNPVAILPTSYDGPQYSAFSWRKPLAMRTPHSPRHLRLVSGCQD
jgi:serine/threonine protein kinase|uniref:Protein kinase domain-containing protein n=1 Tax=Eutreptiella gymnastica TaxID=73025 RepID=A0A7S4LJ82_9EUGL